MDVPHNQYDVSHINLYVVLPVADISKPLVLSMKQLFSVTDTVNDSI